MNFTGHYKLEITDQKGFYSFLEELYKICPNGEYFRAGIGFVYLTLTCIDEPANREALDNLWLSFGPKGIRIVWVLARRPQPERNYLGKWVSFQDWKDKLAQEAA